MPGITKEYLEKEIKSKLNKTKIKYKLTPIIYVPACVVNPKEKIVQILKDSAKKILRQDLITEGSGPWSDMWMFIERGIPAINFGCDGEGAHTKNEYVYLRSLIETTKIYALTALDFLK